MNRSILFIVAFSMLCSYVSSQDLELTEGGLKLTKVIGVDFPESSKIFNGVSSLILDPANGYSASIGAGHNLEIANGDLSINGKARLNFTNKFNELMTIESDTLMGGLSILRNGVSKSIYIDDDNDYLAIGATNFYSPSYSLLELFQQGTEKALSITNTSLNYWDLRVTDNNNLRLFYNGIFKGEFSNLDGAYNPAIVIPPIPNKNKVIKEDATSKSEETLDVSSSDELIITLSMRISHLEKRLAAIESKTNN